jgi:SAM-dependent methyltransferase
MDAPKAKLADYEPESYWQKRYASLDLTRSGHADLPEAYNVWLYRRKQAVLRHSLGAMGFVAKGTRIIEVGAGTGAYIGFWKRLGVGTIAGVDISDAAVQYLSQRHPGHVFLKRDVTEPGALQAFGGGYDMVTALDVLYHVVDDARLDVALQNVRSALRSGGLLAIHDQFLHRASEHCGYIRWRSLADWQLILDRGGFEFVSRTPIFFSMIQADDCASPGAAQRMDALWRRAYPWIGRFPGFFGAAGFALDSALGGLLSEGPSMELMLLRRRG